MIFYLTMTLKSHSRKKYEIWVSYIYLFISWFNNSKEATQPFLESWKAAKNYHLRK